MTVKEARVIYDTLLDRGELHTLFPEATGIWKEDKKEFMEIQEDLDITLSDLNLDE